MGYTNKTSHYELPQYVANDKPSWLGDFNAAMLKIDTVMADNDATADAANSAATGAQTQVAALSAQLSAIQGQVNTAVDTATAADGKATTAQTVANQANTTAGEAKTLANTAKTTADIATETANAAIPKSGGTMTGSLILNGAPTEDNQAATKAYVDSNGGGAILIGDAGNGIGVTDAYPSTTDVVNATNLNIDPNNYKIVVECVGFGKVGTETTTVLSVRLSGASGGTYDASITNIATVSDITDTANTYAKDTYYIGDNAVVTVKEQAQNNTIVSKAAVALGANITAIRVRVQGGSALGSISVYAVKR